MLTASRKARTFILMTLDANVKLSNAFLFRSEGEALGAEEAGFLEEVVVTARVGVDLPCVDVEHAVGEFAEEVDIVRDEDQRAFVGFQRQDKRLDGQDVEVGRRLVHEEKVRGIHQKLHEVETGFFSTAEDGSLFVDVIALEEE
jgi:hypothetical protein